MFRSLVEVGKIDGANNDHILTTKVSLHHHQANVDIIERRRSFH